MRLENPLVLNVEGDVVNLVCQKRRASVFPVSKSAGRRESKQNNLPQQHTRTQLRIHRIAAVLCATRLRASLCAPVPTHNLQKSCGRVALLLRAAPRATPRTPGEVCVCTYRAAFRCPHARADKPLHRPLRCVCDGAQRSCVLLLRVPFPLPICSRTRHNGQV